MKDSHHSTKNCWRERTGYERGDGHARGMDRCDRMGTRGQEVGEAGRERTDRAREIGMGARGQNMP